MLDFDITAALKKILTPEIIGATRPQEKGEIPVASDLPAGGGITGTQPTFPNNPMNPAGLPGDTGEINRLAPQLPPPVADDTAPPSGVAPQPGDDVRKNLAIAPFLNSQNFGQKPQEYSDVRQNLAITPSLNPQGFVPQLPSAPQENGSAPQIENIATTQQLQEDLPGAAGAGDEDTPPPAATAPPLRPSQITQDQLNTISQKDYSKAIYRDPETGKTSSKPKEGYVLEKERGKDRDKDWSIWEKLGAGAIGWFNGGLPGLIQGATDRNYFEKMGDQRQVARLAPQLQQQQESEKFDSDMEYRQAQIKEVQRKPDKERVAFEQKVQIEGMKQIGAMQRIIEKDRLEGKKYDVKTLPDGKIVKKYPDREEPFLDGNGEQMYDLLKKPEAYQIPDGTNADGTPKYKTVYMTGSQIGSLKSSEAYRDGMLGLANQRLEQQNQQFNTTMRQRREEFLKNYGLRVRQANVNKIQEERQIKADLEDGLLDEETANRMLQLLQQ